MSTSISPWWFAAAAILSAAATYIRFSRLMATGAQRRSVAVGIGVGFLVSAGQAAIKHQGAPVLLMIFADMMLGMLALSAGLGEHVSRSAALQSQGEEGPRLTSGQRRRALLQFGVAVGALLALEFGFLIHSR